MAAWQRDEFDAATADGNRTRVAKQYRAENLGKPGPEVERVQNDLFTDDQVVAGVRRAFGRDPATSGADVTVTAFNGSVTLAGSVGDASRRSALGAHARSTAGARAVDNQIWAPGDEVTGKVRRAIVPAIGAAIFAPDGFVGNVAHVIVSPGTYYVEAIVVRTTLCRDARWDDGMRLEPPPIQMRELILPIDVIQNAGPSGVFVRIACRAAAQLDQFDRQLVTVPPATWQPPFPYRRADVFFESRPVTA